MPHHAVCEVNELLLLHIAQNVDSNVTSFIAISDLDSHLTSAAYEQRVFFYGAYVKYSSAKRRQREFEHRFACVRIPSTIHDLANKVRRTESFLNKKRVQQCHVLRKEKLDAVGAQLEHSPRKSLRRLAQEVNISKTSAFVATKLLKLKPFRITVVHALQPEDPVSRVNYCNWFVQSVHNGDVDPLLTFFTDEAWFHLQVTFQLRTIGTGLPKIPILFMKFLTTQQRLGFGVHLNETELLIGINTGSSPTKANRNPFAALNPQGYKCSIICFLGTNGVVYLRNWLSRHASIRRNTAVEDSTSHSEIFIFFNVVHNINTHSTGISTKAIVTTEPTISVTQYRRLNPSEQNSWLPCARCERLGNADLLPWSVVGLLMDGFITLSSMTLHINVCDESATVPDESVDHRKYDVLPRLIEGYDAKDILIPMRRGSSTP
ncbi:hypothetical protein ANN_22536 [Periplaneta americana]|uniref:Uncharacterized protein n=1 Tax=Periplaneta americana TaxID=6978 RepID=A0ABQ8S8N6_PERAM|nr:hypothetical protein ANN_22536 [Periplaneta americana]